MADEKVLTPEEEKVIAKISGEIPTEENLLEGMAETAGKLKDAHQQQHEENMSKVIENASEVLVEGTKEDKLGADMVLLAGIDQQITTIQSQGKEIQDVIDLYAQEHGLDKQLEDLGEKKSDLRKQYNLLKTDIGERALDNYKKTGEKKPALGCEIKMFKNREFTVDIREAIQWCIEKDLRVFLDVDRDKYAEQLALGTFPDMPGKVDDSKIPKASISIKPYQKKK